MRRSQWIGGVAGLTCVVALVTATQMPASASQEGLASDKASSSKQSVLLDGAYNRTQALDGGGTLTQTRTVSGIVIATVTDTDGVSTTTGGAQGDTLNITTAPEADGGTAMSVEVTSTGDAETISPIGRSPIVAAMAVGMPYKEAVAKHSDMLAPGEVAPTQALAEAALRPATPDGEPPTRTRTAVATTTWAKGDI